MIDTLQPSPTQHRRRVGHVTRNRVGGVSTRPLLPVHETDDRGRLSGNSSKAVYDLPVGIDEPRPEDKVLGGIAGHSQLGKEQDVGTGPLCPAHGLEDGRFVAGQVTDHQVELGARHPQDGHAVSLETGPDAAVGCHMRTAVLPFSASRRRLHMVTNSLKVMLGDDFSNGWKSHDGTPKVRSGVAAVTVAVRGPPSIIETSPNHSPAPSLATVRSPLMMRATPSRMRWNPTPFSPSVTTTRPSAWSTTRPVLASWSSSRRVRSENKGTRRSISTCCFLDTTDITSVPRECQPTQAREAHGGGAYPVHVRLHDDSPARLGVWDGLLPRLAAIGWVDSGGLVIEPAAGLLRLLRGGPDPEGALERLIAVVESDRRLAGLALADVEIGSALVALCGASRALSANIAAHPNWLDVLYDGDPHLRLEVEAEERDSELRIFARRSLLRIAVEDLSGRLEMPEVGKRLADVADTAARAALAWSKEEVLSSPRFESLADVPIAVVAMGKWGAAELNYSSDIDCLFVYDLVADSDRARHAAQRISAAFKNLLTRPTRDGIVFRVDADLRPEGKNGPLARSLASYTAYYQKWGEPWESQALLKARPVAGDATLGERFTQMATGVVWPEPSTRRRSGRSER